MSYPRTVMAIMLALLLTGAWSSVALATEHSEAETPSASFNLKPVQFDPDRPETASYFVYDAAPGQVIENQVRLVNSGTAAGTVQVYPVDAVTGQTSGVVYLSQGDPRVGVGSWIELDGEGIVLGPGEERIVTFTLTVPNDARAGQHVGGLVAEDTELKQGSSEGALQVNLLNRTAIAVQVNLPGPTVEAMAITSVTPDVRQGYQMLLLGLRNDGNEMIEPRGALTITHANGATAKELPLQIDTLLPESEIQYPVAVQGQALAAGQYNVAVELSFGENGTASFNGAFEVSAERANAVTGSVVTQIPPHRVTEGGLIPNLPDWLLLLLAPLSLLAGIGIALAGRTAVQRRQTLTQPSYVEPVPEPWSPRPAGTVKQLVPPRYRS